MSDSEARFLPGLLAPIGGVDSCLALPMASMKLAHELLRIEVAPRQNSGQKDLHVRGTQERESVLLEVALAQKKE